MSNDLRLERLIDATPEEVFDAFTDPEAMKQWYALEDGWVVEAELSELAIGGTMSVAFGPAGAVYREDQVYREIDSPRRLAYEETFSNPSGESFKTFLVATFEERDGKTLLTIVQTGFPTAEIRDMHQNGWPGFLDRLDRFVTSRSPA